MDKINSMYIRISVTRNFINLMQRTLAWDMIKCNESLHLNFKQLFTVCLNIFSVTMSESEDIGSFLVSKSSLTLKHRSKVKSDR